MLNNKYIKNKSSNSFIIFKHTNQVINQLDINNQCHLFHIFEEIKNEKLNKPELLIICRDICQKYNISITSFALAKRFVRYMKNCEKFDNRQIFNAKTEVLFVSILEAFSLLDRPLSRQSFLDYVVSKRGLNIPWNASGWFHNFLERFSTNLSLKTLYPITEDRSTHAEYHAFEKFAMDYERLVLENNILDKNKLNIDETRFSINIEQMRLKGIVSIQKIIPSYKRPKSHPCASYVPIINNKKLLISFLVIPLSMTNDIQLNPKKSKYYTRNGDAPLHILYTDSGFVNKESWLFILDKIGELFQTQKILGKKLIMMDNLSIHTSIESIDICFKHNMIPLFLPKYSSQVSQPLDQLVFGNLKKEFKSIVTKKMPFITAERRICLELTNLFDNIKKIVTQSIIVKSWKNCYLIPWNKNNWLNLGKQTCKIPSEESNETIVDELTSMAMTIIQNGINKGNGAAANNIEPSAINDQIPNYFPSPNSKKNNKKRRIKTSTSYAEETQAISQNKLINSKKKMLQCFCQFHVDGEPLNESIEDTWESCNSCNSFRLCMLCYISYPEILVSHEQTCNSLAMKNKRKKRKIR